MSNNNQPDLPNPYSNSNAGDPGYDTTGAVQTGPAMNPFAKLANIIFAPSKAAAAIAWKPDVLLPILLIILTPVLPMLVNFQGYKDMLVSTLAANPQMQGQTADQLQSLANISAIGGLAGGPVVILVMWLLGGLILFGIVKAFGGDCRYKHILSVTGYTHVFALIAGLIGAMMSIFNGTFSQTSLTSLAALLPNLQSGFLSGVATSLDVFSILTVAVLGIAISIIAKLDRKKAYGIVIALFIVEVLFAGISMQISAAMTGIAG